ncbi:MAG: DUF1854 domain-containing protein [Limnohabitans sp.]
MRLHRNARGGWIWTDPVGNEHDNVVVVRAYPVTAPQTGVGVMDEQGHELFWFDRLDQVSTALRTSLEAAVQEREFLPEILQLRAVSTFATPSIWSVQTDRGETQFLLKGEEDIRRLTGSILLINDANGVQYLIRDVHALDRHSRRLLDRFM